MTFPANHALWSKWAPPSERARLLTFSVSGLRYTGVALYSLSLSLSLLGQYVGSIVSFPLTAVFCSYGFDGGWPSAFYVFGKLTNHNTTVSLRASKFYRYYWYSLVCHLVIFGV